jgi:predicted Zn-dependent peptidase
MVHHRSTTLPPTAHALYRKTILPNGLRVVTETIPYVRSISLGIWANVGSRDETEDQNGISHFLEHMAFKGTRKRSVKEIAQSLESVGGYINAFTTKEQTCFYARVLDQHLAKSMDVLTDILLNATFSPSELEKEKLVVLEELKNVEDNPDDLVHDYFEKALFPRHSLGFPIIGTEANLRRFQRSDLRQHVKAHYIPGNLVVAAAGNVDHETLVRLSEQAFKRWPSSTMARKRSTSSVRAPRSAAEEHTRPISQAHVCMGTLGYSIRHRDRYPLMVMNTLLGEGMSSRLYQTIRERYGLAYAVYSFVHMFSDTGVFGAYIGTDRSKIDDSVALIRKELVRLQTKQVPHAELERTKAQMKGTMMLGLESMSNRMMRLGSGELYFESFQSIDAVLKRIDAVTPESILRVAQDLFHKDQFTTVVIRPS